MNRSFSLGRLAEKTEKTDKSDVPDNNDPSESKVQTVLRRILGSSPRTARGPAAISTDASAADADMSLESVRVPVSPLEVPGVTGSGRSSAAPDQGPLAPSPPRSAKTRNPNLTVEVASPTEPPSFFFHSLQYERESVRPEGLSQTGDSTRDQTRERRLSQARDQRDQLGRKVEQNEQRPDRRPDQRPEQKLDQRVDHLLNQPSQRLDEQRVDHRHRRQNTDSSAAWSPTPYDGYLPVMTPTTHQPPHLLRASLYSETSGYSPVIEHATQVDLTQAPDDRARLTSERLDKARESRAGLQSILSEIQNLRRSTSGPPADLSPLPPTPGPSPQDSRPLQRVGGSDGSDSDLSYLATPSDVLARASHHAQSDASSERPSSSITAGSTAGASTRVASGVLDVEPTSQSSQSVHSAREHLSTDSDRPRSAELTGDLTGPGGDPAVAPSDLLGPHLTSTERLPQPPFSTERVPQPAFSDHAHEAAKPNAQDVEQLLATIEKLRPKLRDVQSSSARVNRQVQPRFDGPRFDEPSLAERPVSQYNPHLSIEDPNLLLDLPPPRRFDEDKRDSHDSSADSFQTAFSHDEADSYEEDNLPLRTADVVDSAWQPVEASTDLGPSGTITSARSRGPHSSSLSHSSSGNTVVASGRTFVRPPEPVIEHSSGSSPGELPAASGPPIDAPISPIPPNLHVASSPSPPPHNPPPPVPSVVLKNAANQPTLVPGHLDSAPTRHSVRASMSSFHPSHQSGTSTDYSDMVSSIGEEYPRELRRDATFTQALPQTAPLDAQRPGRSINGQPRRESQVLFGDRVASTPLAAPSSRREGPTDGEPSSSFGRGKSRYSDPTPRRSRDAPNSPAETRQVDDTGKPEGRSDKAEGKRKHRHKRRSGDGERKHSDHHQGHSRKNHTIDLGSTEPSAYFRNSATTSKPSKAMFSQPNIERLLKLADDSFKLDELDLPPDERHLLEKFIDALSKLSVEINLDDGKRLEGMRRLHNALRAIEGWI